MLMACAFLLFIIFCFYFVAARGQTVGPILTSDTPKCVSLGELHSFWGQNNDVTILGGQNFKNSLKLARIGVFQPNATVLQQQYLRKYK